MQEIAFLLVTAVLVSAGFAQTLPYQAHPDLTPQTLKMVNLSVIP